MKRFTTFLITTVLVCGLSLMSACQPYETPAGLDGFWQVQTITDHAAGTTIEAEGLLYYSFEMDLMALGRDYIGTFHVEDDSLYFSTFYPYDGSDQRMIAPEQLVRYGIYEIPGSFAIQKKGNRLTLRSSLSTINLIRY